MIPHPDMFQKGMTVIPTLGVIIGYHRWSRSLSVYNPKDTVCVKVTSVRLEDKMHTSFEAVVGEYGYEGTS